MPIDNDVIKNRVIALGKKTRELSRKRDECSEAMHMLDTISQRQVEQIDPKDATKKILVDADIIDEQTHAKISDSRRQELSDIWIAKADALLS